CMDVPVEDASAFGVMGTTENGLVTSFIEKPETPPTLPGSATRSLVSMGIYIFDMDVLKEALEEDSKLDSSSHDFGKDIIPKLIDTESVYAYQFCGSKGRVDKDCYWRDVGTIDSFYEANMDLLEPVPP
ncbi:glucose-1-phosphate adenylyltransferase, partial [Vibrio parahaemolyticus]